MGSQNFFQENFQENRYFPEIVEAPYTIKFIPQAGHWVQQEAPELVNRYILEYLQKDIP